jgi:transmembrane sensor
MQHDKAYYEALLSKVFTGQATDAEKAIIKQWLYSVNMPDNSVSAKDLDLAKSQMLNTILSSPSQTTILKKRGLLINWPARVAVAAAAMVILIMGYYFFSLKDKPVRYSAAVITDSIVKLVALPDGSKVWLNANSKLEYDEKTFGNEQRAIRLTGEAYFEVQRDPLKPFIVSSGNINTRVLGTGFNIQNYSMDAGITITLVHGSIAVEDAESNKKVLLQPDQQLQYDRSNKQWNVIAYNRNPAKNWMNGSLAFNDVPLYEVLDDMAHHYNRRIVYDKKQLTDKNVTSTIKTNERLDNVLNDILFIHHLGYHVKGEVIYIFEK